MKSLGTIAKLGLFLVFAASVWAQAVSQIQGTVQDASGAAVPGAEVKATQIATGTVRTTLSAADGNYVLPNLPIGPYTVEVAKQGFTKYVQTGIVLQVATSPTIDIALNVGQVSEQVNVEANASQVETQTTSVGSVMETERVLELPLNGRNSADLIQNLGAAVNTGVAGGASSRSMNGGVGYSVAGGQSYGVSYQLDGSLHNNPFDNLNLPLPFPDALQEFKVETSALTAQNGMHASAAVNAVTKSGTNEFHGDAFEFLRNGAVNGHAYFSKIADNLKRNQYGGTVGGPIKKNKLFVFGAYQGTKTRVFTPDNTAFVPTLKMLQTGDFNGCATLKAPAVGNVLDPATFNQASIKLVQKLGFTGPAPCGFLSFGIPTATNEYQVVARTDYQISDKQTLFGRYMATAYAQPPPYSLDQNLLNTIQGGRDNLAQSVTLGHTYLISSTTVNSFRATVNRTGIQRTNADIVSAPDLGVKIFSYMPHYLIETMTSGFNIGGGTENAANFRTTTYQLSDDVNLVRGAHQFAFGATLNQWRSAAYANVRSPGTFTFSGALTGNGLADFLIGNLSGTTSSYLQSAPNTLIAQEWYFGAYAQDTWKITPRLTLNYGVRWEPWFPQQLTNNAVYNFDYSRFYAGTRSTVFKNAPAGFTFPGDQGFVEQSGMNKRWGNLGPRVGLAWDPKGDGRMSIRASYGLAYDFVNGQFYINTANAPPWGSETRITGNVPFDDPFGSSAAAAQGITNIFPVSFSVNAPFSVVGPFIALKPNMRNPETHTWNVSVQRQVGSAWLFSASYIGTETEHIWVSTAGNPGVFGPGATTANLQARRVLTLSGNPDAKYIGFLDFFDDGGTQSYNGMLLSAQRRLTRGLSMNANYTWSHCIGDFTQGGQTPNVGTGYIDPNNRRYDRGPCSGATSYSSDRRHIFNLTAVAETPRFANNMARMLGTGWKVSGIYTAVSGAPINVTTTTDVLQSGASAQRPNLVGDPYGSGLTRYLVNQPTALSAGSPFQLPAGGTLGSLGRFALIGPSFWNISMALSRSFRIIEHQSLEVRAEAFNLTNSLHAGNPTTNLNSALFGQITSTYSNSNGQGPQAGATSNDSRVMQFALKYVF